jgi:hypothetical protein
MMFITNRGFIHVKPKKAFIDWANQNDGDFDDLSGNEGSIYLITDDFYDDGPVIEANFKRIFANELYAVTEDEERFPEITLVNFMEWFSVELGSTVFDTVKSPIQRD